MEEAKRKAVFSRKNEARSLFKKCFKNPMFSLVPFEIWRDIVFFAAPRIVNLLAQTCWGFKELVDNAGENDLSLAKKFRTKGQIFSARKHLLNCAANGNLHAMFHLGHAYFTGDWGLRLSDEKAVLWFQKSAECGDSCGMALYSHCLKYGFGVTRDNDLSDSWAQKALSSKDFFALGYCYHLGLFVEMDLDKAFMLFQESANEGNEFGQKWLGLCYDYGNGVKLDNDKALYWYIKSAEQGSAFAQYKIGNMKRKDDELAIRWFRKAAKQGQREALQEKGMSRLYGQFLL